MMREEDTEDTRERLLSAALKQFAERGFYGASIAQIAAELDLTKQALLYYFKRKEDLYGEVLKRITGNLLAGIQSVINPADTPQEQFESLVLGYYATVRSNPDGARVLLRELMDNSRASAPREKWYMKNLIDAVLAQLDKVETLSDVPRAKKFACMYQIASAVEYFTVSEALLKRLYGEEEFAALSAAYPEQLRAQVRHLIECGHHDM